MTLLMRDNEKIRFGDAQRLVRAVQKNVNKYHNSLEEACDRCDATVDEYNKALALLESEDR